VYTWVVYKCTKIMIDHRISMPFQCPIWGHHLKSQLHSPKVSHHIWTILIQDQSYLFQIWNAHYCNPSRMAYPIVNQEYNECYENVLYFKRLYLLLANMVNYSNKYCLPIVLVQSKRPSIQTHVIIQFKCCLPLPTRLLQTYKCERLRVSSIG